MNLEKELEVLKFMIEKYCHGNHKTKKGELCDECKELFEYAKQRREKCPHGEDRIFCSSCTIHCYKPAMREKIREVMKYSGPRMLFDHPILAMVHLISTIKSKKKAKKAEKNK